MSEALWKQCADWLCRLEVLPSNHRIMWPDATIQDLAYTLRDGVLLCHIAVTLDPMSIDPKNVNQRPQMAQFLCLKNIRAFLQSCATKFGINETDLFQPSMLYDYSDFARVLHTLSRLSNSPKGRARIAGFPNQSGQANSNGHNDEDQIYRTLEELVNEEKYEEFYYRHHGGWGYGQGSQLYAPLDQEEVVYEDLCSFKKAGDDHDETSHLPHPPVLYTRQPKEKRDYCIKELIETEGNYVEVLNMLRKHFIRGLMSVKEPDKKIIFMNINELHETHTAFYAEVRDAIMQTQTNGKRKRSVPEVFIEFKQRFLIYGEFCAALPRSQLTLDQLCSRNDAIKDDVSRCEQLANGGRFRLRDLLAVPMQRVLKYHLLLRELLSHTSISHEEYSYVQEAYESMVDVSDYINEVKRDSEQLHIIREIQASITDWNLPNGTELKDYGRLRKDGEIKIQSHDATNGKTKLRYIFVFDRVLLMCKSARSGSDHYSYKDSFKLTEYRIQDCVGTSVATRYPHAFILVHNKNTNAHTLVAKTEDEKRKWMAGIQEALGNVNPTPRYTHDPMMWTFDVPTNCDNCNKLLKGLYFQGYKCSQCSRPLHKSCIGLASKCGTPIIPLNKRYDSSSSLEPVSTTPPATMSQHYSPGFRPPPSGQVLPEYINTQMEDHPWYVGSMDRDTANQKLLEFPLCTFLVRCRVLQGENVGYALSLRTETDVKHMKICASQIATEGSESQGTLYFLSDSRKFRSVVELVAYFSRHSLKESFSGLDTTLRFPVGELFMVKALYDYTPNPSHRNLLPLMTGDKVIILDRTGEEHGWLKAYNGTKIGYVPKGFVAPLEESQDSS